MSVLKYFDWETKEYVDNAVDEQVEVASLIGDVAEADAEPSVHIHLVIGRRDGTAMAGHLGEAHVRPTLELVLTEFTRASRQTPRSGDGVGADSPASALGPRRGFASAGFAPCRSSSAGRHRQLMPAWTAGQTSIEPR